MIPLYDENRTIRKPVVTIVIIALNALVFLWEIGGGEARMSVRVFQYGAIPYNVAHPEGTTVLRAIRELRGYYVTVGVHSYRVPMDTPEVREGDITQPLPAWLTLLTSMFIHGGWLHILGNMWFLWIFGNNIEDAMGPGRFTVFYLLTGLVAAGVHVASGPASGIPTVGASGAISGVLGAYLVLYPKSRVLSLVPIGYFFWTFRLPAVVFLGIWFLLQMTDVLGGTGGRVAVYAHVGGFLAGVLLVKLFETGEHRRRDARGGRVPPRFARRGPGRRNPWSGILD